MPAAPQPRPRPLCAACRDVIGVYEPAVMVGEGGARATSRAAEPSLPFAGEDCYHLDCYPPLAGVPPLGPT